MAKKFRCILVSVTEQALIIAMTSRLFHSRFAEPNHDSNGGAQSRCQPQGNFHEIG